MKHLQKDIIVKKLKPLRVEPMVQDCTFELDSSTESTEASPEVNLRPRRSASSGGGMVARRGAPSRCFGQQKSGCSGSGCGQEMVPLQPPSGFSDCQQELSEAECDRRETGVSLPLFRHEELEQELSTLVHRYRRKRDKEKQDYTIHV
uniref:Uncharacterized protein n=1 Tax=Timema tahoe TaxID=61484 RepID=A0A7R9IGT3_9NEOP|nr:unnamed protein product [Timema tahoe]